MVSSGAVRPILAALTPGTEPWTDSRHRSTKNDSPRRGSPPSSTSRSTRSAASWRPRNLGDDPLALADREDELTDWLADHDVTEDWLVAPALAAAGADVAWCERVAAARRALPGPGAALAVELAVDGARLLGEVKESTWRVSALVGAARSYSQLDRASIQRTNVVEGLESTLLVLANRLKGVTVVRELADDVPEIEAYAGELNQVWTNLIDNAVDAMDGAGTLRVACRATEQGVVVEIADTGPGIPADVLGRVFEPFFTTKDVGHGTGLGLDISRRIIVERHHGDITIERVDGQTVFRVLLPRAWLSGFDHDRRPGAPGHPRRDAAGRLAVGARGGAHDGRRQLAGRR